MIVQFEPAERLTPQVPPVLENTTEIPLREIELAVIPPEFVKVRIRDWVLPTATLPKS